MLSANGVPCQLTLKGGDLGQVRTFLEILTNDFLFLSPAPLEGGAPQGDLSPLESHPLPWICLLGADGWEGMKARGEQEKPLSLSGSGIGNRCQLSHLSALMSRYQSS